MKRTALAVGWALIVGGFVWAEDTVYFRDPAKKADDRHVGIIEEESPLGIKIRVKKEVQTIPAAQITDIVYTNSLSAVEFRVPDNTVGKALRETRPDKRAELLKSALLSYQDLDGKLRSQPNIHRYLQYKIAHTTALLIKDDPTRLDAAIAALLEFKTAHNDGWEIVPALQLLARLQEDKGDAAGASQTYNDLAEVPGISADMKLKNQLRGAQLLLRVGKFADAETKLNQVSAALAKDDPQRTFVEVYLVQTAIARGNLDGVEAKLKAALNASADKNLRGLAHNFLGDYYRAKKDLDLAFWEYLKVDTLYNEDKEEQAKALYYLAQLFDKPKNDFKRAEACLAKLQSKDYDGTVFQRMAAKEKKTP